MGISKVDSHGSFPHKIAMRGDDDRKISLATARNMKGSVR